MSVLIIPLASVESILPEGAFAIAIAFPVLAATTSLSELIVNKLFVLNVSNFNVLGVIRLVLIVPKLTTPD